MDDLISRQDALKVSTMDSEIYLAINNLPSANTDMSGYSDKLWTLAHERGIREAQQQWIPCSERLPDEGVNVLTQGVNGNMITNRIVDGKRGWWFWDDEFVAWMPLPEPYKDKHED